MRKTIKRIAMAVAFGSLLMGSGAIAHASTGTDQFLSDVQAAGFYSKSGGNDFLLGMANAVCTDIKNGTSTGVEAGVIAGGTGVSVEDAMKFVTISINDLCPIKSEVT